VQRGRAAEEGASPLKPPSTRAANRRFYDALWSASYVVPPQRFNTWPLLTSLAASAPARLEFGPGLRPRLPIAGTSFVDVSRPALSRLKAHGGLATLGEITALPFPDGTFDLVCRAERGLRHEAPEPLARRLRRVGPDAPSGTGDELVQPGSSCPSGCSCRGPWRGRRA